MKVEGIEREVSGQEYALRLSQEFAERTKALIADFDENEPAAEVRSPEDVIRDFLPLVLLRVHKQQGNELANLLAPYWTSKKVQEVLQVPSRQALSERRKNGSVLGLKSADGHVLYPVRQFHRRSDGQIEVRPGLLPLLRGLRKFDPWTVGVLLCTPAPELGGLTPFEWERQGREINVLESLARAVAREWSTGAA